MSIDKLAEFAKDGDKNLDNLDVSKGFLQSEKPERQWFNKLFNLLTNKVNEVVDNIDGLPPFDGGVLADTFVTVTTHGLNKVARTQRDKNSDFISIRDFGAIGNGIADDSDAIEKACLSGEVIDWVAGSYLVTRRITATLNNGNITWVGGHAAQVIYGGSEHTERLFLFSGPGNNYDLNCQLEIDCNLKVNKPLEILNPVLSMDKSVLSKVRLGGLKINNVKRIRPFGGGDAIYVRGAFSSVLVHNGLSIDNCVLGAGAGTSGSIGISGLTVTHNGVDSYVKSCIVDNVDISRVYSEDADYTMDMDAVRYLTPIKADGNVVDSFFISNNLTTFNASGRSIKTQCRNTLVDRGTFERNGLLSTNTGNGEVDSQYGYLGLSNSKFIYSNGSNPRACVNVSSIAGLNTNGFSVADCNVFCDDNSELDSFLTTFPRDGEMGMCIIDNVRVNGKVLIPVQFRCNNTNNKLFINKMYVERVVGGTDADRALVEVTASGTSPTKSASVSIELCSLGSSSLTTALMRHKVAGKVISADLTASKNTGFTDDYQSRFNTDALVTTQVDRVGRIGAKPNPMTPGYSSGFMEVLNSISVSGGATETVSLKSNAGALVFLTCSVNQYGYSSFYVFTSASSSSSQSLSTSPYFKLGGKTEPVLVPEDTNVKYLVWFPERDKMSIKNLDTTSRLFTPFVMNPV